MHIHMVVSLNYCSQNGGNLYREPYYNRNLNIGPRTIGNLDQSPYAYVLCIPSAPSLQMIPTLAQASVNLTYVGLFGSLG